MEHTSRPYHGVCVKASLSSLESRVPCGSGDAKLVDQLDVFIDGLLNDGQVASSSLASILSAARDSIEGGYHVALARRIWDASNDLKRPEAPEPASIGKRWHTH